MKHEITHVMPEALPRNNLTLVETETGDTIYRIHVNTDDSEIEKFAWERKDHTDYGTKLIQSVDEDVRDAVIDAALDA